MVREAKRRRFFEAPAKAFLGDGLPWNWSIWKKHFSDFTAILDFIHVLSYLFLAAKAVHAVARTPGISISSGCAAAWQGEVAQVLDELRTGRPSWAAPQGCPGQRPARDRGQDDHLPGEQPRRG